MNNSPANNSKISSIALTIVICIVLAGAAVIISLLNPKTDFDFIPSYAKPGETHFSDMEYKRPDSKALLESIDELIVMINEGKSFSSQSKLFTSIENQLSNFYSMQSLISIYYNRDVLDEFYSQENSILQDDYVSIYEKTNELLDVIAESSFKSNYERSFFGAGYFSDRVSYDISNAAIKLMLIENDLIEEYQSLLASAFVSFNGSDIYINSNEFYNLSSSDMDQVIELYYQKYNNYLGNLYVELVKTRLELAEELEVNYIEYAYNNLNRDYTPAQANKYVDDIITHIVPLVDKITVDQDILSTYVDTSTSFYYLAKATKNMGGVISEAFDYMVKYGLYDVSYSENKSGVSFQTFIQNYNAPFLFTSPSGWAIDYINLAHEMGHFVDSYKNLNVGITVDNAEIASQAFAFLAPLYSDGMGEISADQLTMLNLMSALDVYVSTSFINAFETAVYSLEPQDITLDTFNALAAEYCEKFNLDSDVMSLAWFEATHIYTTPFYSIGYAISNDVSIQVLEKEFSDPGEGGVKAYLNVIDRDLSLSFIEDITRSGFKSPFEESRVKDIADFIELILYKNPSDTEGDGLPAPTSP